jgi:hypothetical protein
LMWKHQLVHEGLFEGRGILLPHVGTCWFLTSQQRRK